MDSIYDAPRRSSVLSVPKRDFLINGPTRDYMAIAPVVPEVSMICNNNSKSPVRPYNTWKSDQQLQNNRNCVNSNAFFSNKENIYGKPDDCHLLHHQQSNSSQILKKQVRFECPAKVPLLICEANKDNVLQPQDFNSRQSLESDKILTKFPNDYCPNFQQMYMANIPNRHMNLSIIDVENHKAISSKENIIDNSIKRLKVESPANKRLTTSPPKNPHSPKTYKEFRSGSNKHSNPQCVTNILNYRRPEPIMETNTYRQDETYRNFEPNHYKYLDTQSKFNLEQNINKDLNSERQANDEHHTLKDLLKIIQQQNEQIILLQKQVASLTEQQLKQQEQNCHPVIVPANKHEYMTSTKHDPLINNNNNNGFKKNGLSKFSIDLMASSFEVSFRPHQQNLLRKHKDFVQTEPKIVEISDEGGNKNLNETSLHLHESLNVHNDCPSPVPSINIDMNQYDSSNDDDEDSTEVSSSDIGMTFYNNLMEQVNNILKETQIETNLANKIKNQTANAVKETTLKHLRSIGVHLPSIDNANVNNEKINQTNTKGRKEVSFAVKQLLMKYLPEEQLAKIVCNQNPHKTNGNSNKPEEADFILRKPDFSLASIEYMKKYNLIAENDGSGKTSRPICKTNGKEISKILDIKALKLQPKLL